MAVLKFLRLANARKAATRLLPASSNCRGLWLRCVRHQGGSSTTRISSTTASEQLVLLYENNQGRPGFFKLITLVSGVQMIFWGYLSYFAFTQLKGEDPRASQESCGSEPDADSLSEPSSDLKPKPRSLWLFSFDFTSLKWRLGLSLLAFGAGVLFTATACMYPLRMINRIYFKKSTAAALIHTYTPLGSGRALTAPLTDILSSGDRGSSGSHLSLKIRGYPMYFLVDKQNGTFLAPRLYDTLIGSRKKVA